MEEPVPGQTRSDNSDRSAWASLPLHLMDTVLRKLQSDVPSILRIRLVCKAWRAACASFPGPARITMSRGYDIFGVSKTLPGLRELHMSIDETRIYLPPLSALSRLTFLSTEYEESANLPQYGRDPLFDLIILPSGLRALELHCCHVDSESFTHMRCTALTRLLFRWTDNQPWEVEDLLRHLPLLQDLDLGHIYKMPRNPDSENHNEVLEVQNNFSGLLRCGGLSSLSLNNGELPYPSEVPASALSLRKLSLNSMTVAEPFFHSLSILLPFLTELSLSECDSLPGSLQDMHAPSTLRSLEVLDSGPRYLELASPQIQSLTYGPIFEDEEEDREVIDCIAALSGLTALKFARVNFHHQARFSALRRLHLQELSFDSCNGVAAALNHTASLAVLQKLCIKESSGLLPAFEAAQESGKHRQDLEGVLLMREALMRLPSLVEVSGRCRMFSLGMPFTWKLWSRPDPWNSSVGEIWLRVA